MKREDDRPISDQLPVASSSTAPADDPSAAINSEDQGSTDTSSSLKSTDLSFPDVEPSTVGTASAPKGLSTTEIESASTVYPVADNTPSTPLVDMLPASQQPLPNAFGSPSAKSRMNKKRKKLIIIIISAIVAVLLIGAAVTWYFFYFQNSQRVFGVAVGKALSAKTIDYKGALTLESKTSGQSQPLRASASFNGGISNKETSKIDFVIDYTVPGQKITAQAPIKINTQLDTKALYVKLIDFTPIFQGLGGSSTIPPNLSEFASKYNDKWIQFNLEEDVTKQERSKISQCIDTQIKQIGNSDTDSAESKELKDLYMKNQYLVLDKNLDNQTIDGTMSTGYTVSFDKTKLNSYIDGLAVSSFVKNIKKCDSSFNLDAPSIKKSLESMLKAPELKVWIGTFSHEFTRVEATQEQNNSKLNFSMEPHFNQPVIIAAPKSPVLSGVVGEDFSRAFFQGAPGGQTSLFNPSAGLNLGRSGEQTTPVILDTNETIQPLPNRT